MNSLLQTLLRYSPIIADGAWGTELQRGGLRPGECPDSWNLTHPDAVEAIARSYVDAGSRIILSNTFGANRITLERFGLADQAGALNRAGAAISRKAAAGKAHVFASIGPTGKMLMTGEVTEAELRAAFTEQAVALAEGGAEGIVIETMSDLAEASIAVAASRTTGLPVIACMVFDSGTDLDRTMMGATPEQAAEDLARAGADVIGANCGQGIEHFVPLCSRLRLSTSLPIWIKPNAGLPELINGSIVYSTSPEEFARHALALKLSGASFIGGCCGTGPEFIRVLVQTNLSESWRNADT